MGKFCDPASYNNNACRSRDTLGQVPKAEGFWCGCNPPTSRSTSCLGTFPLGPIKYAVGRPRKMGKCNGAKEIDYALLTEPLLFPVFYPPAPNILGFTADPFCGDVEQVCYGEGVGGRRWAHLNLNRMGGKGGRAGSNLSRIRKLVRCDGWRARIYLGSARRPVHTENTPKTGRGHQQTKHQWARERSGQPCGSSFPRVSLAACAIVMRLDLGGKWSRWAAGRPGGRCKGRRARGERPD